jgi:hypothetical protein
LHKTFCKAVGKCLTAPQARLLERLQVLLA